MYVFVAIEAVVLAAAVVLASFTARSAESRARTTALCVIFAIVSFVAVGVFLIATINYRMPVAWIAAIVAALVVLGGLGSIIGRDLGWKPARLLGLLGLFALGGLGFFTFMYSDAGATLARQMYVARTRQIADSLGFVALMPSDEELPTDMLPVDEIPGPEDGIAFNYSGFELWERKATDGADLFEIVAPGAKPMGDREIIPSDADVTTLTVNGAPAVAVEFSRRQSGQPGKAATERVTMFVTVLEGVEVLFWSPGMEKYVDGEWQLLPAPAPAEFAAIAEKLEPVE